MKFNVALDRTTAQTRYWESSDGACYIGAYDRTNGEAGNWEVIHVWVAVFVHDAFYGGIECALDGVQAFIVSEIVELVNTHGIVGTSLPFKLAARKFFDQLTPLATLSKFQAYKEQS